MHVLFPWLIIRHSKGSCQPMQWLGRHIRVGLIVMSHYDQVCSRTFSSRRCTKLCLQLQFVLPRLRRRKTKNAKTGHIFSCAIIQKLVGRFCCTWCQTNSFWLNFICSKFQFLELILTRVIPKENGKVFFWITLYWRVFPCLAPVP